MPCIRSGAARGVEELGELVALAREPSLEGPRTQPQRAGDRVDGRRSAREGFAEGSSHLRDQHRLIGR